MKVMPLPYCGNCFHMKRVFNEGKPYCDMTHGWDGIDKVRYFPDDWDGRPTEWCPMPDVDDSLVGEIDVSHKIHLFSDFILGKKDSCEIYTHETRIGYMFKEICGDL